jgi:ABC-type iron transport system FetAB ATPase subunit
LPRSYGLNDGFIGGFGVIVLGFCSMRRSTLRPYGLNDNLPFVWRICDEEIDLSLAIDVIDRLP